MVLASVAIGALLIEDSQAPPVNVVILAFLFAPHMTAYVHAVYSLISSHNFSSILAIFLILERLPSYVINSFMPSGGDRRLFVMFLDLGSPYAPIRIYLQGYLMNKNSGSIDFDPKSQLISAPFYLLCVAPILWTVILFAFSRWFEEVCPWKRDTAMENPFFSA